MGNISIVSVGFTLQKAVDFINDSLSKGSEYVILNNTKFPKKCSRSTQRGDR